MHPLVPIYAVFSSVALIGINLRDERARVLVWVAAWGTMFSVLFAVVTRPIVGDTWRYYMDFLGWRTMSAADVWESADSSHLFAMLNWFLGQFGADSAWLLIPPALFSVAMLTYSLSRLLRSAPLAMAIFSYSVYPYFVFYIANGIKQGISMALLMQAYIGFFRHQRQAWFWLLLAPLFHTGTAVVLPFIALHQMTYRPWLGRANAIRVAIGCLAICTLLSITNLNSALLAPLHDYLAFADRYDVYFSGDAIDYRTGFRIDFTVFSVLPLLAALWLRRQGRGISLEISGWWVSLYTWLICTYQLFSFAPFADRFAAFGWFLIPMMLMLMLSETRKIELAQLILGSFVVLNTLLLQFYTGDALRIGPT